MRLPPLLKSKFYKRAAVFTPENLLREARRQKRIAKRKVPEICVLDPDGDLVRHLRRLGAAEMSAAWAQDGLHSHPIRAGAKALGIPPSHGTKKQPVRQIEIWLESAFPPPSRGLIVPHETKTRQEPKRPCGDFRAPPSRARLGACRTAQPAQG